MLAREDSAELAAERELTGQACRERPQAAEDKPLAPEQARLLAHEAGVEEHSRGELERQLPLDVAREELGRD